MNLRFFRFLVIEFIKLLSFILALFSRYLRFHFRPESFERVHRVSRPFNELKLIIMGNSGVRKLWFLDSPVETPYTSVYDISVININKVEESLSQYKGQPTVIVNVSADSP